MADELIKTEYFANLMSQIVEFRRDDTFCDVDVVVGSKVFKCHRLVLSAASKYFCAKLKRIMSDERRSSATTEITLPRTAEADIFEIILEFIYTGDIAIRRSNVYDLIRAARYYQVPSIVELCTKFVEENLKALAEDISILLSLAHGKRLKQLEQLLSGYVRKSYGFVNEFSKFTLESVVPISDTKATNRPIMLTNVLEIFQSRVSRQHDATPKTEMAHLFGQGGVDFDRTGAQLASQIGVTSDRVLAAGVQLPETLLHAYVSRMNRSGSPIGTSIYAWCPTEIISETNNVYLGWSYRCEVGYLSTYMRSVCVDGRLYTLSYLTDPPSQIDHQQTFHSSPSISMSPSLSLSLPPYYLSEFDLCGTRNNIYACSKLIAPIPRGINNAQLSVGLFVYKRDQDTWHPLPSPNRGLTEVCITCDEDEIVYLFGIHDSYSAVYVYDPRQPMWFPVRSGTRNRYLGAACGAYGKQIYVAGGLGDTYRAEVYDPIAGNWQSLRDLGVRRFYDHILVNWHSPIPNERNRIVCFDRPLYDFSTMEYLNLETNSAWCLMPSLKPAVLALHSPAPANLFLLDMINM